MVEQIIVTGGIQSSGNFDIEYILPAGGESYSEQVNSCIEQLSAFIFPEEEARIFITQQTFFISARTWAEYEERSGQIRDRLSSVCGAVLPATSIVAQRPESGSEVVLELICTKAAKSKNVIYKTVAGLNYTVVEHENFKEVHGAGMMGIRGDSILEASTKAFTAVEKILHQEGLSVQHIIRQWNYIENIAPVEHKAQTQQNYQVFNDVRSRYYDSGEFKYGYPAATGIGMTSGGVIINFIALSESDHAAVKPIHNPRQTDAHKYSELVLKGRPALDSVRKCTPKFERAKLVSFENTHHVYVSGTASIIGEETLHKDDVEKQTLTTIENIIHLFSRENQELLGLKFDVEKIIFSHLRVYVKYQSDIPIVKSICQSKLMSSSSLYLESDICREDLLVEIEGVFSTTAPVDKK